MAEVYQNAGAGVACVHVHACLDPDCEWCDYLVREGIIISCDHCGHPGHTDALGSWHGVVDKNGGCTVFCLHCAHVLGLDADTPTG